MNPRHHYVPGDIVTVNGRFDYGPALWDATSEGTVSATKLVQRMPVSSLMFVVSARLEFYLYVLVGTRLGYVAIDRITRVVT